MLPGLMRTPCFSIRKNVFATVRRATTGHIESREQPKNPFYDPYHEESIWGKKPRCFYGGKNLVTMAAGVGVGPELMEVVKRVFQCANAPVIFEELSMDGQNPQAQQQDMENLIYSVERNGVAIKGNIEKALEPREISRNMHMRRALDLYVNLIEIKSYPALVDKTKMKQPMDVVLVRQNTEGEFAMLEHETGMGVEHLKITTTYNTERLAEFAFQYAIKHKRRRVIVVYNEGFMNLSEGLFVDTISRVATRYPQMPFDSLALRRFAFSISKFPHNGDVLVTSVLYGGIIMSLLFGVMHGTGLVCGQNLGSRYGVFEPAARNKGYKLEGKDLVNPTASLMCGVKLLRHLGHDTAANRIERAVNMTLNVDLIHSEDIFGSATTSEMVRNIERRIREIMPEGYRDEKPPPLPPTPPHTAPFQSQ